jgi:coenzyme Q-binding protein COQ10
MRAMPRETGFNSARAVTRAAWPGLLSAAALSATARGRCVSAVKCIRHHWSDLFDLVLDLERYPDFVPHCRAVKVFSRKLDAQGCTLIVSRMTVGLAGIEVGYLNRTTGDRCARRVEVEALDGPLSHLHVVWAFTPEGEDRTRVEFTVDYGFNTRLLAAVASRVFDAMFADIVDSFERRANRLFRPRASASTIRN